MTTDSATSKSGGTSPKGPGKALPKALPTTTSQVGESQVEPEAVGDGAPAHDTAGHGEQAASGVTKDGGASVVATADTVAANTADADVSVQREAAGGEGGVEQAMANSVVSSAQRESASQPLEGGILGEMEKKFGRQFDDVRVHTDGAAANAAGQMHANAFTVGRDIYFNSGKYNPGTEAGRKLIAHELTHVVQNTGGSKGAGVSNKGDSAETNAEEVADAVVADGAMPAIGGASAAVHLDRMSDLRDASEGNFIGWTNGDEILNRVRALTADEQRQLERDTSESLVRRIVRALNPHQMTQYFALVAYDLRWKMYWLNQGGHVDSLSVAQWRWVIGYSGAAEMASLRTAYPAGYRMFMDHAPNDLLPPFDKLEGLVAGVWRGNASQVRTAVAELAPAQKEIVKYRADMMAAIVRAAGSAEEKFRTITYLGFQLHQAVHWVNQAGIIGGLTRTQWGQLLGEAPKFQFDALVAATDLWALVQTNCDAALIQAVRQQTNDPTQIGRSLDDQVQADALFTSLGPSGFLGLVTQVDVAATYAKVKARGKVMPVLTGLPKGNRMGAQAKLNIRKWWLESAEGDVPTLEKMFEARFNVTVSGTGATNHTDKNKAGAVTTQIGAWTPDGLQRAWSVCEALPPAQVEGNARFTHMLHDIIGDNGNAYYRKRDNSGEVVLGYGGAGDVASGAGLGDMVDSNSNAYWEYQKNPDGSFALDGSGKRIPVRRLHNVTMYGATVRHEIGHAVDNQLKVMDGWRGQVSAGGWQKYDSYSDFLDAIISDFADTAWNALSVMDKMRHRLVMSQCLTQTQAFPVAWAALFPGTPAPTAAFGPLRVFWALQNWGEARGGPWYHPDAQPTGASGRRFQRAYATDSGLWSYIGATRDAKEITKYQWRAPGEWFAEIYQVYYAEQETDPTGATPVGGILRAIDGTSADMMSGIVDRGFSPQAVQGGGTQQPVGVGAGGGAGTP
ncbi:MAG: DUF4157 domain-containing protein [Kofleriaceae bacterium]